jgi:TRAP-type C4-dicarboxylate transport system substrate-binding protein
MEVVDTDTKAFAATMKPVIEKYEKIWGEGLYAKIQATNPKK